MTKKKLLAVASVTAVVGALAFPSLGGLINTILQTYLSLSQQ